MVRAAAAVALPAARKRCAALWRQYFQYGWWRAVTVRKHRRVVSLRHLAPGRAGRRAGGRPRARRRRAAARRPVLAAWAGGLAAWARSSRWPGWRERGGPPEVAARVPVAVACLHLAYGAGFWSGVAHLLARAARRG